MDSCLGFFIWIAGIILSKGLMVILAIIFPPYAFYLFAELIVTVLLRIY